MKELLRQELKVTRKENYSLDKCEQIVKTAEKICHDWFLEKNVRPKVCCYVSFGTEVETKILIKKLFNFCDIYVPLFQKNENPTATLLLNPDKLDADYKGNISENFINKLVKENSFDFIFTPMLGFNKELYRIGYGIGWYDKFFLTTLGVKIGLAFSSQEKNFIAQKHDIPLDMIITEKGTRLI